MKKRNSVPDNRQDSLLERTLRRINDKNPFVRMYKKFLEYDSEILSITSEFGIMSGEETYYALDPTPKILKAVKKSLRKREARKCRQKCLSICREELKDEPM